MRLALVLALAACNPAFDIDTTTLTPADRDRDGVEDDDDNCIDVPNRDQLETDGDALGDACDGCPGTIGDTNHDEDLDGRPDPCDVCPALDDFGIDGDTDGVGDACDFDSTQTVRRIFEPFATLDGWIAGTWDIVDDSAGPREPLPADTLGIVYVTETISALSFRATIAITATERWGAGDRAGVAVLADGLRSSCTIACTTANQCQMTQVVDNVVKESFDVRPNPYTTMMLTVNDLGVGGMREVYCESSATPFVAYQHFAPVAPTWSVEIVASPVMRAAHLEVLEE